MWSKLPDEIIKNVLSFWSPMDSHKYKVYTTLRKIKMKMIKMLSRLQHYDRYSNYKYISVKKYTYYVNLWNKFVKNHNHDEYYEDTNGIVRKKTNIYTSIVKKYKREIHIYRIITQHRYVPTVWDYRIEQNIHLYINHEDEDWREIAQKHIKKQDCSFEEDTNIRQNICRHIKKQEKTYKQFVEIVLGQINEHLDEWFYKERMIIKVKS